MLIRTEVDKNKVKSIMRMVKTTQEMIETIDTKKFPSNVTKEYYEIIREMISVILLLDGYKTVGEGAHKEQIEYFATNCSSFTNQEILLIDKLRIVRNKIAYDGFY